MNKEGFLKEDGTLDCEKLDLLPSVERHKIFNQLPEELQYQYVARNGLLSLDEFENKAYELIDQLWSQDQEETEDEFIETEQDVQIRYQQATEGGVVTFEEFKAGIMAVIENGGNANSTDTQQQI